MWTWTAALALAGFALPASAESLFRWTAEDGSVAYTDDAKRIPERYRSSARQVETGGLAGYKQYSPTRAAGQAEYREQLAARLERLRALNESLDREAYYREAAAVQAAQAGPVAQVRVGRDLQLSVPSNVAAEGPVVVEDVRVRADGSVVTHHDTVVRQGDRILMVVRGDRETYGPGFGIRSFSLSDFGETSVVNEEELLGEHFLWNRD
jgi:hypothetical protein